MADHGKSSSKGSENASSNREDSPKSSKGSKEGKSGQQLTSVTVKGIELKGHGPINVHPAAKVRPLVVRAKVAAKGNGGTVPVTVAVVLDQYTAKHGTPTTTPALAWNLDAASAPVKTVPLTTSRVKRNEIEFRGSYTFSPGAVAAGQTAFVCLSSANVAANTDPAVTIATAKKVAKKLNGGDCVRIVNVDPALADADD